MEERRWSYSDVALRGGLPRSTVHHLATNPRPATRPNPATLERLAAGLELPLDTIRSAAAAAAGFAVWKVPTEDPEIEVLVAALTRLSAADRLHVAALVRSLLEGAPAEPLGNDDGGDAVRRAGDGDHSARSGSDHSANGDRDQPSET